MKTKKPRPRAVEGVAGWVERRGKVLAVRRPPHGLLGGLWELPGGDLAAKEAPADGMQRALREAVGLHTPGAERLGSVEHLFTHRRLRLHVFRCDTPTGRVRLDGFDTFRWVAPQAVAELPHGAPTKKALRLLAGAETS